MSLGEFGGKRDKTPRLRKKRKVTHKEQNKARAQAPGSQKSLPSLCALWGEVFEKYRLHEMLEPVPRSALESYFRSPRMDTSDERPNNFSSLSSDRPSLNCSSGSHEYADLRNTQAI